MKFAILGGRGYIGSAIVDKLQIENEIFIVKPEMQSHLDELIAFKPDLILNACASKPDAREVVSRNANLDYPLKIFEFALNNLDYNFTWIQLASYYELELIFGRSDPYSQHKNEFRNLLQAKSSGLNFGFRTLFLPHVIGGNERPSRLVITAIKSIREERNFHLNEPFVNLPILIIDDAINAIVEFMRNDQKIATATPVWYKSNKELIQEIVQILGMKKVNFNIRTDVSSRFEKVSFPPKVEGWEPCITLQEYILTFSE